MTIEDIKTYDELDDYCEAVGYENLTDEDINALCAKVREIKKAKIERAMEHVKCKGRPGLVMIYNSEATNRVIFLKNCTEERRHKNNMRDFELENKYAPGILRDDEDLTPREKAMERLLH